MNKKEREGKRREGFKEAEKEEQKGRQTDMEREGE